MWHTLIDKRVLSSVHKYDTINPDRMPAERASKQNRLPPGLFQPRCRARDLKLTDIIGFTPTTPWATFNAASMNSMFADMVLMRHCHEHNSWASVVTSWLARLSCGQNLLLRQQGTDQWFFSLGNIDGKIGLGWPAERQQLDDVPLHWFTPSTQHSAVGYCWQLILDLDAWQGMAFEWKSPLQQAVDHPELRAHARGSQAFLRRPQLRAFPVAPAAPLLHVACRCCFWSLNLAFLKQLANHIGVELPENPTLFEALVEILVITLDCDGEELDDILAQRVAQEDILNELIVLDTMQEQLEQLDRSDREAFEGEAKQIREKQRSGNEYAAALTRRRTESRKKALQSKSEFDAKAKAAIRNPLQGLKFPPRVPDVLTKNIADSMCPPDTVLYEDKSNCRWQISFQRQYGPSRSWKLHGHKESALLVLQWAWRQFMAQKVIAQCPIKGLFSVVPAGAGAGSSTD